jgi:2-dehydro-3-deoxyphosphogluconate aldolase/(4S)-4-hydroxy-2-oxoglutarate aldolase
MAAMMRVTDIVETQVAARLAQTRIIALASLAEPTDAEAVGAALVRGGVGCIELATPSIGLIRGARRVDGLLVGVGNVLTPEQAETAVRGGAHFATAPATNMEVVHACRELELPFFPGAATPSEIGRLALLGVRTLRVFPAASLGGPEFVKTVASIFPDVYFIPSGGIGPESVRTYLSAPSVLAVGVSGVVPAELLRSRNFDRIEWLAGESARTALRGPHARR